MVTVAKLSIEGFRSIRAIRNLELRPLNVLIGANGSGKSNFLNAPMLLRTAALGTSRATDYVQRSGGADRLLHYGSKTTTRIKVEVDFGDNSEGIGVEMRHVADDQLLPWFSIAERELPPVFPETLQTFPERTPTVLLLRSKVEPWRFYHFHDTGDTSPMKKTADLHDNRQLRANGSNLSALLFLLREKHGNAYVRIRQTVRLAAPFFDDFALRPLELNEEKILLEWRHRGSDAYFNASSLSDGTLRFIALATLLLQPEALRPSVILLDEPELGLHPYAITLLASLLKQASMSSQVIVATQSPILLDHFEPEDVLVADRVDGATKLRRLDGDWLKSWLEDYSLGQLWEKNEFGGRPMPESGGPVRAR